MSYYAPFMQPINYYNPNIPNEISAQNFPQQGQQQMNNIQQNVAQIPQNDNSMIWVLGRNEAESYPVAPNNTVVMWDRNQNTIYIKAVNAQGIPSMEVLNYTKRTFEATKSSETETLNIDDFVTKEQFTALQKEFDGLVKKFDDIATIQPTKTAKISKKGDVE